MVRRILVEYSMKLLFYFSFSSNKSLTHLEREKIDESKSKEKIDSAKKRTNLTHLKREGIMTHQKERKI